MYWGREISGSGSWGKLLDMDGRVAIEVLSIVDCKYSMAAWRFVAVLHQQSRSRPSLPLAPRVEPAPPLLPRLSKLDQERLPRLFPHVRSLAAHVRRGPAEAQESRAIHRLETAAECVAVKCGPTREGVHDRLSALHFRADGRGSLAQLGPPGKGDKHKR